MKKATIILALITIVATAKGQNISDSVTKYRDISEYYSEIKDVANLAKCEAKIKYYLSIHLKKQDSIKAVIKQRYIDSLKIYLQKKYKVKI